MLSQSASHLHKPIGFRTSASAYYLLVCALLMGMLITPLLAGLPDSAHPAIGLVSSQQIVSGQTPVGMDSAAWDSIQTAIQAAAYQATWHEPTGAYHAPNPAQGYASIFGPAGLRVETVSASGDLGLTLERYGYTGAMQTAAKPTRLADKNQVFYQWDTNILEWYQNQPRGLEHGFTLAARPEAGDPDAALVLEMAVSGSLTARMVGGTVLFQNPQGETVLRYDGLLVTDALGAPMPAHLSLVGDAGAGQLLKININDSGAVYPLTVDPLLYAQSTALHAGNLEAGAEFGYSLAISGDKLLVGAWLEDGAGADSGAVYLFTRNAVGVDTWGEATKLTSGDAQAGDQFGVSVAISGDTLVVGADLEDGGAGDLIDAAGAAYVFERNETGQDNWGQVVKLTASDPQSGDQFGVSVSISGDTLVVGASEEDGGPGDPRSGSGAVYLFERNTNGLDGWGEVVKLGASDAAAGDGFGGALGISGDTVVVGGPGEDGGSGDPLADAGAAYVFVRNEGGADSWGEVTKLAHIGLAAGDHFGTSVGISGDTLVVGSDPSSGFGGAFVFERNVGGADSWGEVVELLPGDGQDEDRFGWAVAISGDTIVVGAPGEDGGSGDPVVVGASIDGAGAAYVFERNQGDENNWGQVDKLTALDAQTGDGFGGAVAIDTGMVVVGANFEDGGAGDPESDSGGAYLFTEQGGAWQEIAKTAASDPHTGDFFGISVSISGDTIVVGASDEDGGASDPDTNFGAAYVFERNQGGEDEWGQVTKIIASDFQVGDQFGVSVALHNDTLVVGASDEDGSGDPDANFGAAYVFERNEGGADSWGEVAILSPSEPVALGNFGFSVAISDDTIVVGAKGENGGIGGTEAEAGAVYVFGRNEGGVDSWGEVARLTAADGLAEDELGFAVSISGDTMVAGAQLENSVENDTGAAYVFERNQGGADTWGQVAKLTASDPVEGDEFGAAVAIDGGTLLIGARGKAGGAGAAYIFKRNLGGADTWGQVAKLTASDTQIGDQFGQAVAISGGWAVVGANFEDNESSDPDADFGAAYVFERNEGGADNWGQVKKIVSSELQSLDWFGHAVSMSGNKLLVGAYLEDGGVGSPILNAGAAYLFHFTNQPPTAYPGGPYSVDEGGSLLLDGTGSTDPEEPPENLVYEWDLDYENGEFNVDVIGPTPTFSAAAIDGPGERIIALRVTDSLGGTETEGTTISILNVAPSVEAGPDQAAEADDTIFFSGSFDDPASGMESYTIEWDFGDGNTATGSLTPSHEYQYGRTYTVRLTVTDDDGGVGYDELEVMVEGEIPIFLPLILNKP